MFGTILIMCPDDFVMLDKVKKAVDEVDQLVYEVNLFNPDNTAKMREQMMVPIPNFLSSLKSEQI